MRFLRERSLHELFEIGVVLKAIDSSIEILTGAVFALLSASAFQALVQTLTGPAGGTQGWMGSLIAGIFHGLGAYSQAFWAIILLGHGIVKMFLVIGLLKNKLPAFPISAAVFAIFASYQIYQISSRPSFLLEVITAVDIALVVLIIHEYKHRLRAARQRQGE